jgi:hypothetical protein
MNIRNPLLPKFLLASLLSVAVLLSWSAARANPAGPALGSAQETLAESLIRFEYNSSDNDLGVQVFLDGEEWNRIRITGPNHRRIFDVQGKSGLALLGLTELFFEGAEPELDDFPLEDLLALFPEGDYQFSGKTVGGDQLVGTGMLTHAVPAGPDIEAVLGPNDSLVISWTTVTEHAEGFPDLPIEIVGYQVIVDEVFDITLPASANQVTVPPEFVAALEAGEHEYEVLALEAGGNQTITETSFVK